MQILLCSALPFLGLNIKRPLIKANLEGDGSVQVQDLLLIFLGC